MTTKLQHSWQIFKASIALTLRHRKLLWFPFLTTLFTLVIALFFISAIALPLVMTHTGYRWNQKEHWKTLMQDYNIATQHQPASNHTVNTTGAPATVPPQTATASAMAFFLPANVVYLIPLYFLSMFLATFFNVAYYSEIIAALNGRGVSIRRGLGVARSRLPSILAWSLLAGLVGWLIQTIQDRLPFIGKLVTGLIGIVWSVATIFAIPVIIQEQSIRNPVKILQQSAGTLKRTWGEGLLGYIGFSAGNWAVFLVSLIPLLLVSGLAYLTHAKWIFGIALVLWIVCLLAVAYVASVASHIYRCSLYLYAAEGVIPEPYNQELMDTAWRIKKS